MHVDKPKDQDLAGYAITKLHLTSSLTFLKTNIQEASQFPIGPCKIRILTSNFTLFSLKERARKLPWVFLSSPPIHKPKERQDSISFLIHTFSKKLENSKTLSSSLPLILSGPATKKGKSFHARVIYFYFPSRTINLVRILATLTLESMISLKNF